MEHPDRDVVPLEGRRGGSIQVGRSCSLQVGKELVHTRGKKSVPGRGNGMGESPVSRGNGGRRAWKRLSVV